MVALAELKTPDGTFLIQERRAVPREPSEPKPPVPQSYTASPQMTALGGLIIIGVLVGSYTTKYDLAIGHANGPLAIPAVGFLALQLFLARSAYRIFHDVGQFGTLIGYAQNRLMRYLPAVLPAVMLGFLLASYGGVPTLQAKASSLPANLTMMADMLGVPDIDSSHWRLKIEMLLSIYIGLAWFGPLRRHLAVILLVGLGLSAVWLDGEPARQNVLTLHGLMTADGYLPLFAFGIALHTLTQDRSAKIWWLIAAASAVLVFLSNTAAHGVAVLAALAVLSLIVTGRLRFLGRVRVLVFLGELAFPIYVVHFVLGFVLIHHMEHNNVHPAVAVLVASLAAIALGKTVHEVFERRHASYGPALVRAMTRVLPTRPSMAAPVGEAQAAS